MSSKIKGNKSLNLGENGLNSNKIQADFQGEIHTNLNTNSSEFQGKRREFLVKLNKKFT